MPDLKHAAPTTIEEACSLLEEHGDRAAVLSGGQSLLPMIRQRVSSYDVVVDINHLEDQSFVERDGDQLRFGCLVRHADVAGSDAVRNAIPTLSEVAAEIGDVQVRNRGTLCGAIAHGDPAGDPPVVASLFDAEIVARSADGERVLDGNSFYFGFYETELESNELVTEVRFPIPGDDAGAAYEKWEPSQGAYPVATVGAFVELDGDEVADARLVTGALEDGPTEMPDAADGLVGEEPTEEVLVEAATTLGENTFPLDDFEGSAEFKSQISKTLAKDALETAVERAKE